MHAAAIQSGPFDALLRSDAKGFFYLRLALQEYTNDQKLMAIVNRAHGLYDRAVADNDMTSFAPLFTFRREDDKVVLVISKEGWGEIPDIELAQLPLTPVIDPVSQQPILALATSLPVPCQRLQNLSLADLKVHLELYYELVDICTANMIHRLVKSFTEIEQACTGALWRYDLSSSEERLGLSVRKNDKRWMVNIVDLSLNT